MNYKVILEATKELKWRGVEKIVDALEIRLRSDPDWRRSPNRLIKHLKRYETGFSPKDIRGKRILDFGCGEFNPLSIPALFYLNGASSAVATDILECSDTAISKGLFYVLRDCAIYPEKFCFWDTSVKNITSRLAKFDFNKLFEGDWRAALKNIPIEYKVSGSKNHLDDFGMFDAVVSQSVFEHVEPFGEVMVDLSIIVRPGGKMVHYVDFADHDWKATKGAFSRWNFLMTDETRGATHSNRIRLTEMLALLKSARFSCISASPLEMEFPASMRKKLLPEFSKLSDFDLQSIAALIVLQRDSD